LSLRVDGSLLRILWGSFAYFVGFVCVFYGSLLCILRVSFAYFMESLLRVDISRPVALRVDGSCLRILWVSFAFSIDLCCMFIDGEESLRRDLNAKTDRMLFPLMGQGTFSWNIIAHNDV